MRISRFRYVKCLYPYREIVDTSIRVWDALRYGTFLNSGLREAIDEIKKVKAAEFYILYRGGYMYLYAPNPPPSFPTKWG